VGSIPTFGTVRYTALDYTKHQRTGVMPVFALSTFT
jgi:hypothetical protein